MPEALEADIDNLTNETIQAIAHKLKVSRKNVSVAFGYEYSKETIKAIHARVWDYYEPRGVICRLDLSPIDTQNVQVRIRVTTRPGWTGRLMDDAPLTTPTRR